MVRSSDKELELLQYLQVPCEYCKTTRNLNCYIHEYRIPMLVNGVQQPGEYHLTCPLCNNTMILTIEVHKKTGEMGETGRLRY